MLTEDEVREATALLDEIRWAEAATAKEILLEGDAPEKTIKLTTNAVGFAGERVLKVLERQADKLACQKGCFYCCHVMVEVTVPEVLAVAQYIREKFTQEEQEHVMRSIEGGIKATEGMTRKERFVFRVPCPLLKDGACSVYEIRPVTCRAWHSFDVEGCKSDFEHPGSPHIIPINEVALRAGLHVEAGLGIALRSQRLDSRGIEFIRGLKIALEDPSLVSTWRSNPKAFDAAARTRAHPDPEYDRKESKGLNEFYRQATNRPEWSSI